MRVLYLTGNIHRASSNVPVEGWFRLLRPRGLYPVLVTPVQGAFHRWALEQGIDAYQIPLQFPNKRSAGSFLASLARLRLLVRRHAVDIIHCIEHEVYPIGQYLGRLCRVPVVVGVHCRIERGFAEWAFEGRRRPRRIYFISQGSLESCRQAVAGVIPESHWRLLYNGLDLDYYKPDEALREDFRRRHALGGKPALGIAAALRSGKQIDQLVEAACQMKHRNVKVFLAGGHVRGEEDYGGKLLELARARLADRFIYLGFVTDLRGFYNGLDALVNTSKEEACGMSVLEALACGCPVIGYPSVSVAEQVLPKGGLITSQDRPDELAGVLDRWLCSPADMRAGRASARLRAEEAFDIRHIADQLWLEYQAFAG